MRKYGLIMTLPDGKKAGFYAQVVKALAGSVRLFDRDKDLLVLDGAGDRDRAAAVLEQYRVPCEEIGLILLPEGTELPPGSNELGFQTRSGRTFLYADRTAGFRLADSPEPADEAERAAALLQLEEHIALRYAVEDGSPVYICEPHLAETVAGIARRYRLGVSFLW